MVRSGTLAGRQHGAMAVEYTSSVKGFTALSLAGGFFEGWRSPPSQSEHLTLLANSTHVVVATDGARVIGFATAISDRVLSAHIPLLEVLPAYRGRGVGTELIQRLLAEVGPLYMIDVMCDPETMPFYERLGFSSGTGAVVRNYFWRARITGPNPRE